MSKRFTIVTLILTATVAFLVGAIFAGGVARSSVSAGAPIKAASGRSVSRATPALNGLVNFADVVERINPAVVDIDATARGRDRGRRRGRRMIEPPEPPEGPDGAGSARAAP